MARAMAVQAIVESRACVLPAHASWLDAWLDEVCAFGAGAPHDDQVDAMVYALGILEQQAHRTSPHGGFASWVEADGTVTTIGGGRRSW